MFSEFWLISALIILIKKDLAKRECTSLLGYSHLNIIFFFTGIEINKALGEVNQLKVNKQA